MAAGELLIPAYGGRYGHGSVLRGEGGERREVVCAFVCGMQGTDAIINYLRSRLFFGEHQMRSKSVA